MAEDIHTSIVGRANLHGAANYWEMVIWMRPYLFQVSFGSILRNTYLIECDFLSVALLFFKSAPSHLSLNLLHSQTLTFRTG